ncbi:ANTAR domain-containing response regulator [Poriferisphaera sp. WC338]|uniref:ANTAR domain-containing response regulator n=1 Tax=Poriferisphaera sp. WC338 TaxID=3425129 RepID=UPI003D81304E
MTQYQADVAKQGKPCSSGAVDGLRNVLIAEDEHLLARNLSEELEGLGYNVLGLASNGKKAIEMAEEQRPDMVLLDLRMPEMSGLEAASILYQKMGIPVLIISAYSDKSYVDEANHIGVFGYLLKPVGTDALRVAMSVAWRRFNDQQKLADEVVLLEKKLTERKVIERAKGLIMMNLNLSESEAMRRLQKQSRDTRKPMVELAQAVIDAQELMEGVSKPADS